MNEANSMNQFNNEYEHKYDREYSLKYQLRINNQNIETIKSHHGVFTFGRFDQNDIHDQDISISRIQCFIFMINDSIYIMDGWSLCGTRTKKVITENGYSKNNLNHSVPNNRMLLRFKGTDTIHLQCGDQNPESGTYVDLIINPRECRICRVNARSIRISCGHYILCNNCYYKMDICPLCQKPIKSRVIENDSIGTYHQPSIKPINYH